MSENAQPETTKIETEKIGPYRFSRQVGRLFYGAIELTDTVTPEGKMLTGEFVAAMPQRPQIKFNHRANRFNLVPADQVKVQALTALFTLPDRVASEM
jgi:hypothetical protein